MVLGSDDNSRGRNMAGPRFSAADLDASASSLSTSTILRLTRTSLSRISGISGGSPVDSGSSTRLWLESWSIPKYQKKSSWGDVNWLFSPLFLCLIYLVISEPLSPYIIDHYRPKVWCKCLCNYTSCIYWIDIAREIIVCRTVSTMHPLLGDMGDNFYNPVIDSSLIQWMNCPRVAHKIRDRM